MSNTAKGGLIGGGGGAALGALVGGLAGKGKGAAIGAAVGAAVGTGAGVLIGKKMDKAAQQAQQIEGAEVEQVTDRQRIAGREGYFRFRYPLYYQQCNSEFCRQGFAQQVCQQCSEPEPGYGRGYLWLYGQSGLEKFYQGTECSEEPESVAGTRTECIQLFAGLWCFSQPDQECGRYG